MKIIAAQIYGYGKLENVSITNIHDFQVFYGENEAGKSTIMSFIHSILFGFPAKQHADLRYEPKTGAKYGGQLTIIFPTVGKSVIERVKGKSAGDVRVILEDGTIGEEELLQELLYHVDKTLFQSIFSFNIHGLQNIQHMKAEDLGRFLFSVGSIGSDQLISAESILKKELESRFKPSGKKPIINERLIEIRQMHKELKKAEQKNGQYWMLLENKEALEKEINGKQQELLKVQNMMTQLEVWRQVEPLIIEEQALREELIAFENIQFPADGLLRLERLEGLIKPIEGKLGGISKRIDSFYEELTEHKPNEQLLAKEAEIFTAVEKLPLLEKLIQEEKELAAKFSELADMELLLQEKLHFPFLREKLLAINTSVFMKEKVLYMEENSKQLKAKKQRLDEKFNEKKQMLEEVESKIAYIEEKLLPKREREAFEEKLSSLENQQAAEQEFKQIEDKLNFLQNVCKKEKEQEQRKKIRDRLQISIYLSLFTIFFLWGIKEWILPLVFVCAIGIGIIVYNFFKKPKTASDMTINEEIRVLEEHKKIIEQKRNQTELENVSIYKMELERDQELHKQLKDYKFQWDQKNEQYEKVIAEFETWEREKMEHEKKQIELGQTLSLPKEIALSHLTDAFMLLEQQKTIYREKEKIIERQKRIKPEIQKIHEDLNQLQESLLHRTGSNLQETAYLLKTSLKKEAAKQIKYVEKKAKLIELEEEYEKYSLELKHYKSEQEKLFQMANTNNTEHYREIGRQAEKREKISLRIKEIQRQIKMAPLKENELQVFMEISNPALFYSNLAEKIKELEEEIPRLQNELAEKKYEIQVIEDGGTYAELLHTFKQRKDQLQTEAKEWAKFALAKELLTKSIDAFKKERLPKMLEKAERILFYLTDGKYIRIHPKIDSNGFLIESKDKMFFEANELSQAAAEQLYVAIRLALAISLYAKFPFPIIIDDSFVNFDHNRTKKVIELLKSLSGRQILFFTCHRHILPYFKEEQIMQVNTSKLSAHLDNKPIIGEQHI